MFPFLVAFCLPLVLQLFVLCRFEPKGETPSVLPLIIMPIVIAKVAFHHLFQSLNVTLHALHLLVYLFKSFVLVSFYTVDGVLHAGPAIVFSFVVNFFHSLCQVLDKVAVKFGDKFFANYVFDLLTVMPPDKGTYRAQPGKKPTNAVPNICRVAYPSYE